MTQENQNAAPESQPGGYGTPTAEQELGGAQGAAAEGGSNGSGNVETNEPQADTGSDPVPREADVPSSEAELDETNDDSQGSAPVSSEPGQEAAGIPDGSGNDLPADKAAKDGGGESFDAG